ncbi:polysaccharide deacetylase family protein [Actinoplanes sp. NPDC049681]|uniref:polysaccharide deacetylase family protein n=1 Tax=Actinoplanes sp. NPDC049681 TaxID=3363905 RepID=UPI00378BD7C4
MPERIQTGPGDSTVAPVLLYHDVTRGVPESPWQITVSELAAQLDAVVACGRTVLDATALDAALAGGSPPVLPLCAVTFDDGYASFAELALPLLRERGLPATLYVTTGYVDRPGMLSEAALRDIAAASVEIGGHAVHHVHLDLRPATADAEIRDCRARLAGLLGQAPASFAYPHGSFHGAVRDAVARAGYANGYAVKNAFTHADDEQYARARLTVLADTGHRRVGRWLTGRGAPRSWHGERLRTTVYRRVRAARERAAQHVPKSGR